MQESIEKYSPSATLHTIVSESSMCARLTSIDLRFSPEHGRELVSNTLEQFLNTMSTASFERKRLISSPQTSSSSSRRKNSKKYIRSRISDKGCSHLGSLRSNITIHTKPYVKPQSVSSVSDKINNVVQKGDGVRTNERPEHY